VQILDASLNLFCLGLAAQGTQKAGIESEDANEGGMGRGAWPVEYLDGALALGLGLRDLRCGSERRSYSGDRTVGGKSSKASTRASSSGSR
jgi:hypothetical protein